MGPTHLSRIRRPGMAPGETPLMRLLRQDIAAGRHTRGHRMSDQARRRTHEHDASPSPLRQTYRPPASAGDDLRDRLASAVTESPVEVLNAFMVDAMARVRSGTGKFECGCDSVLSHRPDSRIAGFTRRSRLKHVFKVSRVS
jgi:hypothetical protein